jgi:hypothetical protein
VTTRETGSAKEAAEPVSPVPHRLRGIRLPLRSIVIPVVAATVASLGLSTMHVDASRPSTVADLLPVNSCSLDRRADPGAEHVDDATYDVIPPSGGDHHRVPAPVGIYEEHNRPPLGYLVHALEHGYVVLWHQPDASDDVRSRLRTVAARHPRDVIVAPLRMDEVEVAATAWTRRLLCSIVDVEILDAFVREARNRGPERVPHG